MNGADEEVERVSDALNEVDRIPDREARVRARNQVLALQAKKTKEWHKERRELVLEMRAETPPVPIRKIAERLGMSAGVVQDIVRGHSGAWKDRPARMGQAEEQRDDG
ncbi:hypothetical protein [Streptomyces sp. NPDC006784]|uniref:hypothetical protein n=1 Tax=Streptomyces sp. NPDC006784 TaxID=3364764 RepID=UPI0036ADE303